MNFVWILALHYVIGNTALVAVATTTSSSGHGVGFYIVDGLKAGERHDSTNLMLSSNATNSWNQTKDDEATTGPTPMLSTQLHQAESSTTSINTSGSASTNGNLDDSLSPTPSAFRPSLNISWPGHLQDGLRANSSLNGNVSIPSQPFLNASAAISSGQSKPANRSDVDADLCWEQWQPLWKAQRPLSAYDPTLAGRQQSLQHRAEKTAPRATATSNSPSSARVAGYTTVATTETVTIIDAGHTIATEVTTYSVMVKYEGEKPVATHSILMPDNFQTFYTMEPIASFIRTPTCHLPASYSSCQSEWNTYLSNAAVPMPRPNLDCHPILTIEDNTPIGSATQPPCYQTYQSRFTVWSESACAASPPCSQAQAPKDQCTAMRDGWVAGNNPNLARATVSGAFDMSNGFIRQGSTDTWSWPTTLKIAPDCTLGCGRCAGGTIQLLFWPPGLHHDATAAPLTLNTLGTILTSPTNYISFKSVSAADACSDVGPTLTSRIIAIPTDASLSTKYGVFDLDSIGSLPLPYVRASTAPLNISNLMLDPVPYSIYASQPWCASHELTQMYRGSRTSCETSRSYSPILVVPDAVLQSLAPEWASCSADLRGLYDPPIALQPVEVAASPTLPAVVTSQRPMNGQITSQVPKTYIAAPAETLASLQVDYKPSSIRTSSQASRPNVVEQVISVITAVMLPSSHDREKPASGLIDSRTSATSPSNALDVLQEAQQQEPSLGATSVSHSHLFLQTITSQAHTASTPPKVIFTLSPIRIESSEGSVGSGLGEEVTVYPVQRGSANAVVINDQITVVEGAAITSHGHREYSLGGSGLVVYDHDSIVTTLASESLHEMFQPSSGVVVMVQDRLVTIFSASTSAFVVNGVTLTQGGTALILDDLTLSNAPAGIVAEGSGGFFTILRPHTGPAANATTSELETTTHSSSLPTSISALETTKPSSTMSMTTTRMAPGGNTEVPWSELSKASKASFSWLRVCPAILLAICAAL